MDSAWRCYTGARQRPSSSLNHSCRHGSKGMPVGGKHEPVHQCIGRGYRIDGKYQSWPASAPTLASCCWDVAGFQARIRMPCRNFGRLPTAVRPACMRWFDICSRTYLLQNTVKGGFRRLPSVVKKHDAKILNIQGQNYDDQCAPATQRNGSGIVINRAGENG